MKNLKAQFEKELQILEDAKEKLFWSDMNKSSDFYQNKMSLLEYKIYETKQQIAKLN